MEVGWSAEVGKIRYLAPGMRAPKAAFRRRIAGSSIATGRS